MNKFFCADASRQAGEDIIGSAANYQTYVLVQCPTPWEYEAFDSKHIPYNLQSLVEEVTRAKLPVRFLLIANNQTKNTDNTKVLIYDKSQREFSRGYNKQEFNVENIEKVAGVVKQYLAGEVPSCEVEMSQTRDILVCTHGSHDQCCARYGNPFYAQAVATISELGLRDVRVWKASHFGGHRFAPTAIDFPDGRYYGALDGASFKSILMRVGEIQCFNQVYRGWGILPHPLQVLEREFILRYGWDWFNYKVAGKIIEQNSDKSLIQAELGFEKPNGFGCSYHAELVKDGSKTLQLKGSCGASKESVFVKYAVTNLRLVSEKLVCLNT
jgi:hypothetical protein